MKQRGFAPILMILVLLGAGVLAYFGFIYKPTGNQSQTPSPTSTTTQPASSTTSDPTANWKTFSGQFGTTKYTFKYPENLSPFVGENGGISFFEKLQDLRDCEKIFKGESPMIVNSPCLKAFITISVTIYSDQDFAKSGINPASGTSSRAIDPKTFKDNIGRTWQTDMVLGEVFNFAGLLQANGQVYIVGIQSGFGQESDTGNSFRNLANNILSTFKFTQGPSAEIDTVRAFGEKYASAYQHANWPLIKTFLTKDALADMNEKEINLPQKAYLTGYKVMSIYPNTNPVGYKITIRFYLDGQPQYQLPSTTQDPTITVIKENGEWKSMTWYLYQ